ncbi:Lectin 1 putative immunolectin, partial [Operophtera brumata]
VSSTKFRFDYSYSTKAEGWLKLHEVPATWKDAHSTLGGCQRVPRATFGPSSTLGDCQKVPYDTFGPSSTLGVPLSRMSIQWAPGQPDNYKNSESCLVMLTGSNGSVGDVKCTDVFPFVCYKKRTQSLSRTWPRAYTTCIAEGGHLVIINSDLESQVIRELYAMNPDNVIVSVAPSYAFIGTYDFGDGSYWLTIHGETPKEAGFERWNPDDPNNGTQPGGEFCGCTYRGDGSLYDAPCEWVVPSVCEMKPQSLQKADGWLKLHEVPATWNDAQFLCKAEVQTIFTGVHSIYSKGVYSSVEGVPLSRMSIQWAPGQPDNFENSESCLVMLPGNNGTVGDLKCTDVFPFVCYKKRTQSLYNLDARTGSCYKFHRRSMTWPRAYTTCIAEGGHLVIINSDLESQVIRELYAKNPDNVIVSFAPSYAAIGIYDFGDGSYWLTIHGETPKEAGFERWKPGDPNNATQPGGEFCGITNRGDGLLYDAPCGWVLPFICEMKPQSLQDL